MRLFVAVDLPAATRSALHGLQGALRDHLREVGVDSLVHWTAAQSLHLTLCFLGETNHAQQKAMEEALSRIAASTAPFHVETCGIGVFPGFRRPSIVWTGVRGTGAALQSLTALHGSLAQAARGAGCAVDDRPYSPHLTLGRFRRDLSPTTLAEAGALLRGDAQSSSAAFERHALPVDELLLMRSDLRPEGAIYHPIARFRLAGEPPKAISL